MYLLVDPPSAVLPVKRVSGNRFAALIPVHVGKHFLFGVLVFVEEWKVDNIVGIQVSKHVEECHEDAFG